MSVDLTAMGKRVRSKRLELGLTQQKMAEQLGVSLSFYGHIERGTRVPSIETLVTIANCLNVGIDYLLADSLTARGRSRSLEELNALRKYLREQVLELDFNAPRADAEQDGADGKPKA